MNIKIGTRDVTLSKPSPSLQWELAELAATNPAAASGAALGLCWSGPSAPFPLSRAHRLPLAQFGREVFDLLLSRKDAPYAALRLAGAQALDFAVSDLIGEEDVAAAEGFSGAAAPSSG